MSSLGSVILGSSPMVFPFASLICHSVQFKQWSGFRVLLAGLLHWQHDLSAVVPLPSHPQGLGRWEALRGNTVLPDTSTGLFHIPLT